MFVEQTKEIINQKWNTATGIPVKLEGDPLKLDLARYAAEYILFN